MHRCNPPIKRRNNPPEIGSIETAPDGIPILRGILTSLHWVADPLWPGFDFAYATIAVRCPVCRYRGRAVTHWHGWHIPDRADSIHHRVAHCCGDVSLMARGYYIALLPDGHIVTPGVPLSRVSRVCQSVAIGGEG